MNKEKKYLIGNHFSPEDLYEVRCSEEETMALEENDWFCKDVSECNGLYLVAHDNESIYVNKVNGETKEEVKENLIKEITTIKSSYELEDDGSLEIPELETIGVSYIVEDAASKTSEEIANEIFAWIKQTEVDGDSGSKYEFMEFNKNDKGISYEEFFQQ